MAIDLLQLVAKFKSNQDVETAQAYYRTKVPWVAPEAYLHTIYKAAPPSLVSAVSEELRLPASVVEFYGSWNGAHLFVNALSIYGCVARGTLLDRTDRFKLPPFDLREANGEMRVKLARRNLVALAWYSLDGSTVYVERETGETVCSVGKDFSRVRMRWQSVESWLLAEVQRMALLFDESGNQLADDEQLLPVSAGIN